MTHLGLSLHERFQSAYQKCHSTETALLHVVHDLLQESDDGHMSILSLLDLSPAFDMIDRVILSVVVIYFRLYWNCSWLVRVLLVNLRAVCLGE